MKIDNKQAGYGKEMPPLKEHVTVYFIQKGFSESDADLFFQQHQLEQWKTISGKPIRNWKAIAADYVWELNQQRNQRQEQKNYCL